MHILYYQDLLTRTVQDGDAETLEKLAQRLADSEEALEILRAKGYGNTGLSLPATVRLVPEDMPKP